MPLYRAKLFSISQRASAWASKETSFSEAMSAPPTKAASVWQSPEIRPHINVCVSSVALIRNRIFCESGVLFQCCDNVAITNFIFYCGQCECEAWAWCIWSCFTNGICGLLQCVYCSLHLIISSVPNLSSILILYVGPNVFSYLLLL